MSEIPIAGETCCANCVNDATCSHRSALPGIALICDLFVNRTFPPEVQDAIRAGDRCPHNPNPPEPKPPERNVLIKKEES